MKIGLYPGSFDPITLGHLAVIEKGSKLFDKLYICVLQNALKNALFSTEDRVEMIKRATSHLKNVEVVYDNVLTVEACKKYKADFILRGLRSSADFEFEFESNNINYSLDNSITTVLVMTDIKYSHISSTVVRELLSYKSKEYKKLVPEGVYNYIENKLKEDK